jgi:glycosyltransferase involved in cell wall biosynthesis
VRVLLVVHGYPPHEQSGTELYTAELAQALARAGHDVAVFAGSHASEEPAQQWRRDGLVEVERMVRPRRRLRLEYADASVESALLSTVNRFGPDIVHVHHLLGLTMPVVSRLKARGIPVALTLHDHWFLCPEVEPFSPEAHPLRGDRYGLNCFVHLELLRPRRTASMVLERDPLERARRHQERARVARAELEAADLLITPSRFLRGRYAAFGVPESKLFVLPHGVGLDNLTGRSEHAGIRIGCLSPLLRDKGVDLLVRAFRGVSNPDARLEIRGPAPDEVFARRLHRVAVLDERIGLGGGLPHDEVGGFLASLDLLVVPSRFEESFSLVAHEALAARVPVLASDAGALPEIVTEGLNGALFRPGSMADLQARLRELVDQPDRLAALNAFPTVKSMAAHAAELAALYRTLEAGEALPQPLAR